MGLNTNLHSFFWMGAVPCAIHALLRRSIREIPRSAYGTVISVQWRTIGPRTARKLYGRFTVRNICGRFSAATQVERDSFT